ncbi:transcriptional regulator [uncultured Clostridium sp.]|uniref:transcriptional regulator n=1 Tax=uncultured Clostridium sp. TaxID=59620 RepID=UPI00258970A0|nr:transcriptional regulator [uncultured Clostridium sp.]
MGKQPTKAAQNVYCIARKEASKFNPKFSSREGASEYLGISKDSLTDYELDLCKVVPVDKVVIMADAYNAPHLLNNYCCNECPIGKKITPQIDTQNIDNLYRFAIATTNNLANSQDIQQTLLKIVEDGVIDESEQAELDMIIRFFSELEKRAAELKILAQKYLRV